ncbi:MAG: efflux RND transporter periplasmic adaptor subunit [Chthoniobacteraceae bacterium]
MLQHPISEKPSNLPGSVPEKLAPPWKRHLVRWSFIIVAIAALGYWHFRGPGQSASSAGGPGGGKGAFRPGMGVVPVVATPVVQKDLPIYLEGLGTVQALNTVTIRPRVDGQLVQVAFTEGQLVKAGDVLAKIDPAPYLATLAQAEAKKRQDEATLANARLDLARYAEMLPRKATSQQTYDTQKALVAQDEAAVSADEASVQSARVQLAYTTLASPIEGRVGLRQIDPGNIIYASGTTGLVEVTQLHPITVIFTLPQQNLPAVREEMAKAPLPVVAVDRNDGPALGNGTLSVFDNAIDSTTGTIKLKAVFPNDDLKLWPGQFVNARLLLSTRKNAVVVPAAVIQRGPNGEFAFVIAKGSAHGSHGEKPAASPSPSAAPSGGAAPGAGGPELAVEVRPVKVALIQDGQALIDSGLKPGEQVVLEGQYRLQANSRVRLEKSSRNADADAEP